MVGNLSGTAKTLFSAIQSRSINKEKNEQSNPIDPEEEDEDRDEEDDDDEMDYITPAVSVRDF